MKHGVLVREYFYDLISEYWDGVWESETRNNPQMPQLGF